MKIAIASSSNTLNSRIDKHLARCSWFLLYETKDGSYEFVENPCKSLQENAGLAVINLFKLNNIKRIITTDVGYKIKSMLDELKIQIVIISDNNKKMKDFIDLFKTNK